MPASRPLWLAFAPVIFLCLWSGGYAVAKLGLHYTGPLTLLALRFGVVVVVMGAIFIVLRPPVPKTRAEWGHLAMVGFLIQAVYFGMSYIAFHAGVAAGTVALLMSLQPVLVALIVPRWNGERVGGRQWLGLGLGLAGAGLVISARLSIETPSLIGFVFAFLGLAGITGGSLWEKRFGLSHHPVTANLVGYAAGLVGIVPAMLLLEDMQVHWTWEFGAALAYLVIGNSVIAVGLLLAMIRAGDVARVSALLFLVPPGAALVAWALLGEVMPPLAWLGMAVAGAGVFLAMRKEKTSRE
ncbi:DMT family transporter [Roseovarius faecimaris]|uniref:DMT family transporter n=1 Tax=Roseovarius faecimaris TaxID=2494550 RepID=A0A6I6IN72_9RHOB|nr:DMT family transporter [Roseovarius faecimaris]QGX98489.1 DMT family transporter [Roseovarius faecimaris]